MKKTLIIIGILVALFILPVSAANVGDKISEAVYTDIVAYVNNYPMPTYVVDGYAVIVAEDLRDYCCDVTYDNATRSLYITKAGEGATFAKKVVYKSDKPTGAFYKDVLYTDIKTYVNGNEVKSFNVNGKTMIVIDEFGKNMDGYTWDGANRAAIAYLADKDMAEFKVPTKRTEVLFKKYGTPYEDNTTQFHNWYDINFDGIGDYINFTAQGSYYSGMETRLIIGNRQKILDTQYFVHTVLVTDIDLTDGVRDLVVFSWFESGELEMKIIKCDSNMTEYKFVQYEISNWLWLGCPGGNEESLFTMNEDGTFSVQRQTPGMGMWGVISTYRETFAGSRTYAEVPVAYYEIQLDDFMNPAGYSEMGNYERNMWAKGYIRAYTAYKGEGVNLKKNDYFKVLYDNAKGYVYIVKTNGEAGWIYIDNYTQREALNRYFFYMAG